MENEISKKYRTNLNAVDASMGFLFAILGLLIVNFIFGFVIVIQSVLEGGLDAATDMQLNSQPNLIIINLFCNQISFILIYFIFTRIRKINPIKSIGINKSCKWSMYIILPLLAVFLLASNFNLITSYSTLLDKIGFRSSAEIDFKQIMSTPQGLILTLLAACVMPAIAEELIFRGLILQGLASKYSEGKAVVLSSFCFMLMHMSPEQTIHQFILGVLMAYAVLKTRTIWSGVIIHLINNVLAVLIEYYSISIYPIINFDIFVYVSAPVLSILAIIICTFVIDYFQGTLDNNIFVTTIRKIAKLPIVTLPLSPYYDTIHAPEYFSDSTAVSYEIYLEAVKKSGKKKHRIFLALAIGICLAMWLFALYEGLR